MAITRQRPKSRQFLASELGWRAVAASRGATSSRKPNISFLLIDDMGLTDLHSYGGDFYESPNIDKLARDGMRFTQAYSACMICSSSRAAILTGKYPARLHSTDFMPRQPFPYANLRPQDWVQHLPLEGTAIAESLTPLCYAQSAIRTC